MGQNNNKEQRIKIVKRSENFSRWYLDVIRASDMADYTDVKGCMVIKPYGYALWENIQRVMDKKIKETGHENAYFPLLIPESFLRKEAEHIEGFSPELAVVTYAGGKKLEEKLVIRPTSETIIYSSFAKWVRSWRDLPILINQWCNVVRWEMRTRPFLRTSEFLWQEGHTAHATHKQAKQEAMRMLFVYQDFVQNYLAIPVIPGVKSESEKFAGALKTFTVEALMQDGKALQCGTSHDLGQNFARAFEIKFLDREDKQQYVWQTSWGVSTRLIGAVIMTHGDDKGVIIPPRIAPLHIVIIPIWSNETEKRKTIEVSQKLSQVLSDFSVKVDDRDLRPGYRYYEWERKGVPLRVEVGPKDVDQNQAVLVRRDTGQKLTVSQSEIVARTRKLLQDIQKNLFFRAQEFLKKNTHEVESWQNFQTVMKERRGFVLAPWCGSSDCEAKIKEVTKATIRCLPFKENKERKKDGQCLYCDKPAHFWALFAQAY